MLFFSNEILNIFIASTNSYGFKHFKRWKEIYFNEFIAFLGIILTLGVIKYPSRKYVFEKNGFGNIFVQTLMNLNRFNNILNSWHYVNENDHSEEELKRSRQNDPFFVIKPFVTSLSSNFQKYFNCGQKLDIDEQCIPWKGRYKCRCYNPNKPTKFHFKVFSLNDSETGYMTNFYLYQGKSENRPEGVPATLFPFHKLLNPKQYMNKNHIIYTDNWYTSISSLHVVLNFGNHYIGTVKTNRKGIPSLFTTKGNSKKKKR